MTARFLRFQGQPWVTPFWRNEALFALYPGNSWFWRTTRLRDLPLIGLAKGNYPEYVPHVRGMLKPFGISPRFVSLVNDGISTLFTELEARHAAAILTEGTICIMPRTLTARSFTPLLPGVPVTIGLSASRPNPLAEKFAQMLLAEVRRQEKGNTRGQEPQ